MAKIVTHLREQILSGDFPPGARMQTLRVLAEQFETTPGTVRCAMIRLESEGLIACRSGRNNVVLGNPEARKASLSVRKRVAITLIDSSQNDPRYFEWPFYWGPAVISGISSVLTQAGVEVTFANLAGNFRPHQVDIDEVYKRYFRDTHGVIFFPCTHHGITQAQFANYPIPMLTLNRIGMWQTHNFVSADYFSAGNQLAQFFAPQRSEKILLLGSQSYKQSWREISMGLAGGFLQLTGTVPKIESIEPGDTTEMEGSRIIAEYFKDNSPPSVVVTAGDYLAMGAIRACREAGLSIPGDVQIVGGANDEVSKYCNPPLSAISQPVRMIGYELGNLMIKLLSEPSQCLPGVVLPTNIEWRSSTRAAQDHDNREISDSIDISRL